MAEARQAAENGADQGSGTQWGGSLARCLCAGRRPARAAAARAFPRIRPRRATRRNAPLGDRARHERSGVGPAPVGLKRQKVPGALPPDPLPSLKDERLGGHPLARSGKALRRNPGSRKGSLRSRQTLAAPGNPTQPAGVPDRGDDLRKPRSVPHSCHTRATTMH